MKAKNPYPVVNIRLLVTTRDRLKIKAARKRVSMMQYIDELSRVKNGE